MIIENMQSLDNKTLIHIGVETAVIGGVAFWFHKKTAVLHEEIAELRKIIESQNQMLQAHEGVLRQIIGGQNIQRPSPPVPQPQPKPMIPLKTEQPKPMTPLKTEQIRVTEVEDEPDIEDTEFNDILSTELNLLECNGDSCET